jgi:putative tricarboxylic transport membrane protein
MDAFSGIADGFAVALSPENLLWVLAGVVIGMVIGVLPGLGPAPTIALLLPITYTMSPEAAVILLAGIYYGSMYGGTITSVLLKLPGEAASVVTALDGHQMARQGRAGSALGIAAIGSFIGGTVSIIGLTFLAVPLAGWAVKAGPPEYAALTLLGILFAVYLGTGHRAKAMVSAMAGLLFATVGQDPIVGSSRFTFGSTDLLGGLDFVAIAMGVFGVGEILYNLEREKGGDLISRTLGRVLPTRGELKQSRGAIARGSVLGFLIGILPGGGGVVSSLASYGLEKRVSKTPGEFGRGAIAGVAGPETANNASSNSAFVPLLTLGLPSNVVLAMIFGALLLQGITPGPSLISEHPAIFWGVIASMYVGNLLLLVLNLPLVGVFVQLLRVRIGILGPLAVLVTMCGVYSLNNSVGDMWIVLVFGLLGYLMRKTGFEPGPMVLAFVLGVILERSVRQSLILSGGELTIFLTRPVSAVLVVLVAGVLVIEAFLAMRSLRGRDGTSHAEHMAASRLSTPDVVSEGSAARPPVLNDHRTERDA